jgi:hypothetical protein
MGFIYWNPPPPPPQGREKNIVNVGKNFENIEKKKENFKDRGEKTDKKAQIEIKRVK